MILLRILGVLCLVFALVFLVGLFQGGSTPLLIIRGVFVLVLGGAGVWMLTWPRRWRTLLEP